MKSRSTTYRERSWIAEGVCHYPTSFRVLLDTLIRLGYDAAAAKYERLKCGKKEKEKKEAEEEMQKAKER